MSVYSAGYDFAPNDKAWVLSGQTVEAGTVLQTTIIIADDATLTPVTTVTYLVLLNCNAGTATVTAGNIFASLEDAVDALQTYMNGLTC